MDVLIIDGAKYLPWTPKDEEKEFHPLVEANSKEIFGKDSIYFNVKTMIRASSGIGSIPDAYVIKYSKPHEWYVIENELATHPVYDHVVKQLSKFINGIENKGTKNQILDMLYEMINGNPSVRAKLSEKTDCIDVYHFLSKLILKRKPRIVVIIDKISQELEEARNALSYTPDLIELKTFVKEDDPKKFAHLFEPLTGISETKRENGKVSAWQNWSMMLKDVDEPIRRATMMLIRKLDRLDKVVYKGKTSCSAYIKQQRVKYGFVGLAPRKSELRLIIRHILDLNDPKGWVNQEPTNWFTSREIEQERSFTINDESQVDYAFELIKQSYELIKKTEFSNN